MHEDLEPIANLRIAEVVEQVSRERAAKLPATIADLTARGLGHPDGGPMIQARLNSALDSCEQICRGLYEIWLDLIQKRNHGRISSADVDFIKAKVEACVQAQTRNLISAVGSPTVVTPSYVTNQGNARASSVTTQIGRELEIKLREQEAFPPPDLSLRGFVLAFDESWTTRMSGPITVAFTIAALYLPGYLKFLFAVLAITSGVYSSYELWRRARSQAW